MLPTTASHLLLSPPASPAPARAQQQQAPAKLGADPDQEARDATAAELGRWVQDEAQRRSLAKKQALSYATGARLQS